MKKLTLGITAMLLLFASAAFAQKVTYNFLPGTDFSKYRTYQWQRVEKAAYPNQLLDEQITRSIDAQLRMKGLQRVDSGGDLVVVYQAAVAEDKQWNSYSTGDGGWGWGGWGGWGGYGGMGMSTTTTTSSTIHTGSIDLDMYDVASRKQIWRGEVSKTIKQQKDPAKLQKNLDKAMEKLLKNYPPPPKK
jgi:hypothetical protein